MLIWHEGKNFITKDPRWEALHGATLFMIYEEIDKVPYRLVIMQRNGFGDMSEWRFNTLDQAKHHAESILV